MLYHTNQITDIQVKNVEYVESKIIFHAIYQPKNASCPCCAYQIYNKDSIKKRIFEWLLLGISQPFFLWNFTVLSAAIAPRYGGLPSNLLGAKGERLSLLNDMLSK